MGQCTCWGDLQKKSVHSAIFDRSQGVLYTDVGNAVSAFRDHSTSIVQRIVGTAGLARVDVACSLVEAILLGVNDHLPRLKVNFKLFLTKPDEFTEDSDVISLVISFDSAPLVGEIATRSRIPHSVQLASPVRFSFRMPSSRDEDPLVLRLKGLSMPSLPEIAVLDEHLRSDLGPSFDGESSYDWWQLNKDQHFPHHTSKLRRLLDSLFEQKFFQMQRSICALSFWSYTRAVPIDFGVFEFHGISTVTITAQTRPSTDPRESVMRAQAFETTRVGLTKHRKAGEQFCRSSMNFAALLHAHELGQPRAHAKTIIKLFSPAKWWGPGTDRWHQWDETWLCIDKKNSFGLVSETQGRILWHQPSSLGRISHNGHIKLQVASRGESSECKNRKRTSPVHICLMVLVVMFTAVVTVAATGITQKLPLVSNLFDF